MFNAKLVECGESEAEFTVHDGAHAFYFRKGHSAAATMFVRATVESVDGRRGTARIEGYDEPCAFVCEVECAPGDRVLLDGDGRDNYAWANIGRAIGWGGGE